MTANSAQPAAGQVFTNLLYAPEQPSGSTGHLLDLYLPSGFSGPRPLLIWTNGSAWFSDDGKSGDASIASVFNPLGYAVAGVNIRSSPEVKFPGQVFDIKAAIRWLRANASKYDLDPSRFAIMGFSSGAWAADMATVSGGVASLEGNEGVTGVSSSVQAGVAFSSPTDFLQNDSEALPGGLLEDNPSSPESQLVGCSIQACPGTVKAANPVTYVTGNEPPLMLLHGQSDTVVPWQQSQLLYKALAAKCDSSQLFLIPGAGHEGTGLTSSSHFGSQTVDTTRNCQQSTSTGSPDPSWNTIASFLNSALGVGSTSPPPPGGACQVTYTTSTWQGGFTANVTVTNDSSSTINGWTLTFMFPGGQKITTAWNATPAQSGQSVSLTNVSYNPAITPGGSQSLGFQGTWTANDTSPSVFALNGTACTTG